MIDMKATEKFIYENCIKNGELINYIKEDLEYLKKIQSNNYYDEDGDFFKNKKQVDNDILEYECFLKFVNEHKV